MPHNQTRLEQDIYGQPLSQAGVLEHQRGTGRKALEEAAALLKSRRQVVITAMGGSLWAAIPLEYYLNAHGIPAVAVEAAELLHYRRRLCEGAAVLMVSRSGESVEIVKLLDALRGQSPVVGVTNETDSTLARQADICIQVHSLPDEIVAIQSYTGSVLALMLLGTAAAGEFDSAAQQSEAALSHLPEMIARADAASPEWNDFLGSGGPVYLLGRGPSYGSAMEGSLLFHETAKGPALGMAAASFRHGPVEAVDNKFRAIVFAPEGKTRSLNLALAREILRLGGLVKVIGPSGEDAGMVPGIVTPAVPEMWAPLIEIVPVQFAAMRLAALRGLPIGVFRHSGQVTRDETTFSLA
jgi:glucosamine--fructose-6-phosphate aminotransferase (isomerizing)